MSAYTNGVEAVCWTLMSMFAMFDMACMLSTDVCVHRFCMICMLAADVWLYWNCMVCLLSAEICVC